MNTLYALSARVASVLTVAKVTAGGGAAYAAYLEGRAQAPEQGDYYLKDGERVEAPGRWALGPEGAAALGLDRTQPVDGEAFHALMAVRHPMSGETAAPGRRERRGGRRDRRDVLGAEVGLGGLGARLAGGPRGAGVRPGARRRPGVGARD